jgi:hypothetical protein
MEEPIVSMEMHQSPDLSAFGPAGIYDCIAQVRRERIFIQKGSWDQGLQDQAYGLLASAIHARKGFMFRLVVYSLGSS